MGKRRNSFVVDDEIDDKRHAIVTKKVKNSGSDGGAEVDSEGNTFWELSGKRRVVIQKFKSDLFVNLREYYEDKKSGEMRPGKKGIMLNIEQYKSLVNLMPTINAVLLKQGVDIAGKEIPTEADDEEPAEIGLKGKKLERSKSKSTVSSAAISNEEKE